MFSQKEPALKLASFRRRLAAWVYDVLVIVAILMLATGAELIVLNLVLAFGLWQLPAGVELSTVLSQSAWHTAYLFSVAVVFFAYFWRRGGQTLGMRAWRLQLKSQNGQAITWWQAIIRAICALGGLGSLLVIVDRRKRLAFQDYFAKTYMVELSKEQNQQVYKRL